MSALDKAIDGLEWWMKEYGHPDLAAEASDLMQPARADLAALRQRCEDLETLLGLALNGGIQDRGDGTFFCWSHRLPMPYDVLPKGMDGLPVLTDEARKALRGGK